MTLRVSMGPRRVRHIPALFGLSEKLQRANKTFQPISARQSLADAQASPGRRSRSSKASSWIREEGHDVFLLDVLWCLLLPSGVRDRPGRYCDRYHGTSRHP